MKKELNRRAFLKQTVVGAAGASGLMALLGSPTSLEAAEVDGEYNALVVVLLEGGADVFNMIAPTQTDAYDAYKEVRQHLALTQDSLLPITDTYGMRENMGRMQQLYQDHKLAVIANVGTLVKPTTLQEIKDGSAILPSQLFAHNTQRDLWMLGSAKNPLKNGWAARTGDAFYTTPNPYFNVTVAGNNLMQTGRIAEAIAFDNAYVSPNTMRYYGFGPESGGSELGNTYQDIYESRQYDSHKLMGTFAKRRVDELVQQETLGGKLFEGVSSFDGFNTGVHETGKPLGKQLEVVAKILSVRENFPGQRKRQIFFVNHHGWDTHDSDNEHQAGYLSDMLGAFYNALETMGITSQVTTLTISDFGRSLSPNGAGTDHGWGSHAFVMGGAVKGGEIYGTMPQLIPASPDAWIDRMIPTTSMESYLGTIVKWFGATEQELDTVFPNRHAFAVTDMGFMK